MPGLRFLKRFARAWSPSTILCASSLTLLAVTSRVAAQDAVLVDALAGILQVEDERRYDGPLLEAGTRHPEPLVRRVAVLAMGRIGDPAAAGVLLEILEDPDSIVQSYAAFSLGLLGDTAALTLLGQVVLNTPDDLQHGMHAEAVTAIAKIGGPEAAAIIRELLGRWTARASSAAPPVTVVSAIREAWRLEQDAPADLLVEFTVSPLRVAKLGAVYSLARLRAVVASDVLLAATGSREEEIRADAVRALTAAYADSAGLDRIALANRVRRLVSDPDPHVRINALRTLATYHDSTLVPTVIDRLSDGNANVRVQAIATLTHLGGSAAIEELRAQARKRPFAVRRQALIGMARLAGIDALSEIGAWLVEENWIYRAAGAEALGYIAQDTVIPWLVHMTNDPDPRVAAPALASLTAIAPDQATRRAQRLIRHQDAAVRAVAADRLASVPDTADIDRLVAAYQLAARDSTSAARIAILGALGQISRLGFVERIAVEERFLTRVPASPDYIARRAVEDRFPEAAKRWGPVGSLHTGRGIEDYRDIARRFVAPGGNGERRLIIETTHGPITIELFTQDAPLTISTLWQLVDQRYFDAGTWHRVVPNFVIQGGDPRGDGWGGPGFALRDEINLHRYSRGTVGMALSGPDTGGSQFFITHSPQSHLDGTFTVIGRVDSGMEVVDLITQGDRIRRIRRP